MRSILLIMIGLSTFAFADFTKNGDIVIDNSSGLQWQDDTATKNIKKSWNEAIGYCENLILGGYSDWRLPNVNELKSIVDRSKENPAIVSSFENTSSNAYWSSTTNASNSDYAWIVNFYYGFVGYDFKDGSSYVRCVRAGQ